MLREFLNLLGGNNPSGGVFETAREQQIESTRLQKNDLPLKGLRRRLVDWSEHYRERHKETTPTRIQVTRRQPYR